MYLIVSVEMTLAMPLSSSFQQIWEISIESRGSRRRRDDAAVAVEASGLAGEFPLHDVGHGASAR
jgi:hypothetical protein